MEILDKLMQAYADARKSINYGLFKHHASWFYMREGIVDPLAQRHLRKAVNRGLRYVLDAKEISEADRLLLRGLILKSGNNNLRDILSS